jgi:hypothetical protein
MSEPVTSTSMPRALASDASASGEAPGAARDLEDARRAPVARADRRELGREVAEEAAIREREDVHQVNALHQRELLLLGAIGPIEVLDGVGADGAVERLVPAREPGRAPGQSRARLAQADERAVRPLLERALGRALETVACAGERVDGTSVQRSELEHGALRIASAEAFGQLPDRARWPQAPRARGDARTVSGRATRRADA